MVWWKISLIVAGSILILAAVFWYVCTYEIFAMSITRANSRIGRKSREKLPLRESYAEEEWLLKQQFCEVSITSFDGLKLQGYYLPAEHAKRTILMMHGWRGTWAKDFGAMAKAFHERSCNLLLVDERGHGKSEGEYFGFGVLEEKDCRDWAEFLVGYEKGQYPIYLCGISMGAAAVQMAAGRQLPKQVKGVIADCGFTRPYDIIRRVAMGYNRIFGLMIPDANRMCMNKAHFDIFELSATDSVAHTELPVFYAHGTADNFVPFEMTQKNYDACAGRKVLFAVEGAAHCMSFRVNPEGYLKALWEFFQWNVM